jgi:hypothetical protein
MECQDYITSKCIDTFSGSYFICQSSNFMMTFAKAKPDAWGPQIGGLPRLCA